MSRSFVTDGTLAAGTGTSGGGEEVIISAGFNIVTDTGETVYSTKSM